jgi:hypothetical protein
MSNFAGLEKLENITKLEGDQIQKAEMSRPKFNFTRKTSPKPQDKQESEIKIQVNFSLLQVP